MCAFGHRFRFRNLFCNCSIAGAVTASAGWSIVLSSTMTLFNFKIGTVSGVVFGHQAVDDKGDPTSFLKAVFKNLDQDHDGADEKNKNNRKDDDSGARHGEARLDHVPLWTARLRVGFPHAEAALVGVAVVAGLDPFGQGLELLGVTAT